MIEFKINRIYSQKHEKQKKSRNMTFLYELIYRHSEGIAALSQYLSRDLLTEIKLTIKVYLECFDDFEADEQMKEAGSVLSPDRAGNCWKSSCWAAVKQPSGHALSLPYFHLRKDMIINDMCVARNVMWACR